MIAPLEIVGFVVSYIENNAKTCPIVYKLFCEYKFVYIINRETIVKVVKQIKKDVIQDEILEIGEILVQNKEETTKRFDGLKRK